MANMVHIRNTSGSQLDIATVGLLLEKNAISADTYDYEKLKDSSEIKKYQQLHFIQLMTSAEADKARQSIAATIPAVTPPVHELETETPAAIQKAVADLRHGLDVLEALVKDKTLPVKAKAAPSPNTPPPQETETAQGTLEGHFSSEAHSDLTSEITSEASEQDGEDDDDSIPDRPPVGMQPHNDPVKRVLGTAPYTQPMKLQEQKQFVLNCMDIGMLRELALFAAPGTIKTLAKKKLRQASAAAGLAKA